MNMRKVLDICSILCAVIALLSLVFGIRALTGHNFFIGLRLFNMVSSNSFMGFIGNITGLVITCAGFGALAWFGFTDSKRKGFIYGTVLTVICVISMIAALISRSFTAGDLIITAIPAVYTFATLRCAG